MYKAAYVFVGMAGIAAGMGIERQRISQRSVDITTSEGARVVIEKNKPVLITLPKESVTGMPVAKIVFPADRPDMTRRPAEDKITPPDAKKATPAAKVEVAPGFINAWNSNFGPCEYFRAHRHPEPRFVLPWIPATLGRTHEDGSVDTLELEPNTALLFATDPVNWHNDFNTSKAQRMRATVIEVSPSPSASMA